MGGSGEDEEDESRDISEIEEPFLLVEVRDRPISQSTGKQPPVTLLHQKWDYPTPGSASSPCNRDEMQILFNRRQHDPTTHRSEDGGTAALTALCDALREKL